jgi:hypothetical protein
MTDDGDLVTAADRAPVPEVPAVPEEPSVPVGAGEFVAAEDGAATADERADLAVRAGLSTLGPVPEQPPAGTPERAAPGRAQIVVDRSELLRMFSGLKDE